MNLPFLEEYNKRSKKKFNELTPFLYFINSSFCPNSFFTNSLNNLNFSQFTHQTISKIEKCVFQEMCYDSESYNLEKYENNIISSFFNVLSMNTNTNFNDYSENIFKSSPYNIWKKQNELNNFFSIFSEKIKKDVKKMPIKASKFPSYNEHSSKNSNEISILQEILRKESKDLKFDDFIEYYNILQKYPKSFSFSHLFVDHSLNILDNFLRDLFHIYDDTITNIDQTFFQFSRNTDSKSDKFKIYRLILLIKMRLFMNSNKMHNFLTILLQLIILDQENPELKNDNIFSYEQITTEIIPKLSVPRSTIIKNLSKNQIFDFCFDFDSKSYYFLVKEGVFKYKINSEESNQFTQIEIKNQKIHEILNNCKPEEAKLTFSNKNLYLLLCEDKTIHKVIVLQDEKISQKEKEKERKEKIEKIKNPQKTVKSSKPFNKPFNMKNGKKSNEKVNKNRKRKDKKRVKKMLRKKRKIERKLQRRLEKFEFEEDENTEQTFEYFTIDIQKYPIISIGYFNYYIRIIQIKSYNEGKSTLIFTNIDLTPNSRIDFEIEEEFSISKNAKKIHQTQKEIEIEDKNGKIKIKDILFSNEFMYICYEDSTLDHLMILKDGNLCLQKRTILPIILTNNSIKIDEDQFLHSIESINFDDDFGISLSSIYLPKTKHWIKEENSLFLHYPYLHQLSSIVNNCSQVILDKEVVKPFKYEDIKNLLENDKKLIDIKQSELNKFELKVTPNEMGSLIQIPYTILPLFGHIKNLIRDLKDEDLKRFFIILFIKLSGINLYYETNGSSYSNKIDEKSMKMLALFKSYILDLYSLFPHSSSTNYEIMIKESMIYTISICGKFLFIVDQDKKVDKIIIENIFNDNNYSKLLLKSFLRIIFSYPSSVYLINKAIYDQILEFKDEVNISDLFMKNVCFLITEPKYLANAVNEESINLIQPFVDVLFNYIYNVINDKSNSITIAEQLLSFVFGCDLSNPYFSLELEKQLIKINKVFYERIKENPEVIESDKEFLNLNQNINKSETKNEVKIIESEHPYNPMKKSCKNDLGTIKFESNNVNTIYVKFDERCKISDDEEILIQTTSFNEPIHASNFNQIIRINSNYVRVIISRKTKESQKEQRNLWGYKITFTGTFNWRPNEHLDFYNYFISFLTRSYYSAYKSTKIKEFEKAFNIILDDDIIQGIKYIDIVKPEINTKSLQKQSEESQGIPRQLSQDASRGLDFDIIDGIPINVHTKKQFLYDIISYDENNENFEDIKKFLDCIYHNTRRNNRINLSSDANKILLSERYFIACILKQLGLVSIAYNFQSSLSIYDEGKYDTIKVPEELLKVWLLVYKLRNKFHYKNQEFKQNKINIQQQLISNFEEYLEEVRNKCILMIYSSPILIFKKGDEQANLVANKIFNFVTSDLPVSNNNKIIEIRRIRLSISYQSISLMNSFIIDNQMFESSRLVFANFYNNSFNDNEEHFYTKLNCKGEKVRELNNYDKLFGEMALNIIKNIFSQPSIGMICSTNFLTEILFYHDNDESKTECFKIIFKMLENNKNNKSVLFKNRINFTLILILLYLALYTKRCDLGDQIIDLLADENIDLESKHLILTMIPSFTIFLSDSESINDNDLVNELLNKNKEFPIIIKSIFGWYGALFFTEFNDCSDFILKILKGIGQSFIGKSCLFIDESFQPFAHRQVSEGMISSIRLLYNFKNESLIETINELLTNSIKNINFDVDDDSENVKDEVFQLIGLFASFGYSLSSIENDRNATKSIFQNVDIYNVLDNFDKCYDDAYANIVLVKNFFFDLNQEKVENIFDLNEKILKSKYFAKQQNYENHINLKEIAENILISTFYSFLPILMQNKNNAKILFDKCNIERTLSIFELSKFSLPSNENSIIKLSHYIEQAIFSPLYNDSNDDSNDSFRFMKMNFGQIIHEKEKNDIIISDKEHHNVFIGNRPIDSKFESYFEIKINKIGPNPIFIGFIDLEEFSYKKAVGFDITSPYFICGQSQTNNEYFPINKDDLVSCYYTNEYLYLSVNEFIAPYRISHKPFKTYSPIIYIEKEEVEFEITQNPTIRLGLKLEDEFELIQQIQTNEIEKVLFIGEKVFINKIDLNNIDVNTSDEYLQTLHHFRNKYGIIKNIEDSTKLKIESYNDFTLSKEIIKEEIDVKNISIKPTNFFSLIENRTNTKFGFNSSFDVKNLNNEYQIKSNLNEIRKYMKNKTIKENSKSIAIIMTRYLVFILIDYLRHSKSKLLQDEGINSTATIKMIESLVYSLPTITQFNPKFDSSISKEEIKNYIIFYGDQEQQKENLDTYYKIPGLSSCFSKSFKAFLLTSESFLSPKFYSHLLQFSFEISSKFDEEDFSCSSIYELIPTKYKIETISPLNNCVNINKQFSGDSNIGFIPILLYSIPDQLPSLICNHKRLRSSSDQVSYFYQLSKNEKIKLNWNFDIEKGKFESNEFKLKCGIFFFSSNLSEKLLKGPFGFIQIVFNVIQHFINSENLYMKYIDILNQSILENIYSLSMKKNNFLISPLLRPIIITMTSINQSFDIFTNKKSSESFSILSNPINNLYRMKEFPTYENEVPLIFSLYSNLIQFFNTEQSVSKSGDLYPLFEKYYSITKELFNVFDNVNDADNEYLEGSVVNINKKENPSNQFRTLRIEKEKKKKNFRFLYLLFYYSILLKNEKRFPYPLFLFYHDRMNQLFGGFRKAITFNDIKFQNQNPNQKSIKYESEIFTNTNKLECSYKLIKLIEIDDINNKITSVQSDSMIKFKGFNKNTSDYKVFVHFVYDDDVVVEIPKNGDCVTVSFPLKIVIEANGKLDLREGDVFVIDFSPSKEQQKEYFVSNYDNLQKEFNDFISLEKYDDEFSKISLKTEEPTSEAQTNHSRFNSSNSSSNSSSRTLLSLSSSPMKSNKMQTSTKNTKNASGGKNKSNSNSAIEPLHVDFDFSGVESDPLISNKQTASCSIQELNNKTNFKMTKNTSLKQTQNNLTKFKSKKRDSSFNDDNKNKSSNPADSLNIDLNFSGAESDPLISNKQTASCSIQELNNKTNFKMTKNTSLKQTQNNLTNFKSKTRDSSFNDFDFNDVDFDKLISSKKTASCSIKELDGNKKSNLASYTSSNDFKLNQNIYSKQTTKKQNSLTKFTSNRNNCNDDADDMNRLKNQKETDQNSFNSNKQSDHITKNKNDSNNQNNSGSNILSLLANKARLSTSKSKSNANSNSKLDKLSSTDQSDLSTQQIKQTTSSCISSSNFQQHNSGSHSNSNLNPLQVRQTTSSRLSSSNFQQYCSSNSNLSPLQVRQTTSSRLSSSSFHHYSSSSLNSGNSSPQKVRFVDIQSYEMKQIPLSISMTTTQDQQIEDSPIVSLRYFILTSYNRLFKNIMSTFASSDKDEFNESIDWRFPLSSNKRLQNLYMKQIYRPASLMPTELKFELINQMIKNEKEEKTTETLHFSRVKSSKSNKNENKASTTSKSTSTSTSLVSSQFESKDTPLFIQLIKQVNVESLHKLKVYRANPFRVNLIGENAHDNDGPGREIFSLIMEELMNPELHVFAFNPNKKQEVSNTNQESMIPYKLLNTKKEKEIDLNIDSKRFIYAGALIAICIVSEITQPIELSMIIWEYLSKEIVSIQSIYEIDYNFKALIEKAENLLSKSSEISDEKFKEEFKNEFEIWDSFGNVVDLSRDKSIKEVTKENLEEFIELSKNYRIHEFDNELKDLKIGFEIIMQSKSITKILKPNELKLLVYGEKQCKIEQMKNVIKVDVELKVDSNESKNSDQNKVNKLTELFWETIESFSIDERLKFIRFSSGYSTLPALGLRWEKDLIVRILSQEKGSIRDKLPHAVTCTPRIDIPYFESKEELARALRICINYCANISDNELSAQDLEEYI